MVALSIIASTFLLCVTYYIVSGMRISAEAAVKLALEQKSETETGTFRQFIGKKVGVVFVENSRISDWTDAVLMEVNDKGILAKLSMGRTCFALWSIVDSLVLPGDSDE